MLADLLNRVKGAPELEREALKIAIAQLRQAAEQMKEVRDLKHLQALKMQMLANWKEINELAKGDRALLDSIQQWGESFVDSKILFYETINEVKEELVDTAQEVQETWDGMQLDLGKAAGLIDSGGALGVGNGAKLTLEYDLREFTSKPGESYYTNRMAHFLSSVLDKNRGFDEDDADVFSGQTFLEQLNTVIAKLSGLAHKAIYDGFPNAGRMPVDQFPQLPRLLEKIVADKKMMSQQMKKISKLMAVVKKIRDTHFLKVYNQRPETEVA